MSEPDYLASDAERNQVAELLGQAYRDGKLDLSEHEDRVGKALSARHRSDLAALLADLPSTPVLPAAPLASPQPTERAASWQMPSISSQLQGTDPSQRTAWGDISRGGSWYVPARSSFRSGTGDIKLDLREAYFGAPEVQLDLRSRMGEIEVRLPDGVVLIDQLTTSLGDHKSSGLTPPVPGAPTVLLTGGSWGGNIQILGPYEETVMEQVASFLGLRTSRRFFRS